MERHGYRYILALAGGLSIAAAFLRFSLWPLAWVGCLVLLLSFWHAHTTARSIRLGFVGGLAANIPAFYWLVGTIHLFGGFPLSISVVFYVALSLYSSLQFVLLALFVRRAGFGPMALSVPLFWVSLEFLFPNLFPWRLANSQLEHPELLQIGEITGPFGLSFVMVWWAAAAVVALREGRPRGVAWATAAVVAVFVHGIFRIPEIEREIASAPTTRIGIVQGNLSVEEKGNVLFFENNMSTYRVLTHELGDDLDVVIWPESVIAQPLQRTMTRLPPGLVRELGIRDVPLMAGAITWQRPAEEPELYNSVVLFDRDGSVLGMSDKQILMPFGEFMPFATIFPALRAISPQTGDFEAGDEVTTLELPSGARLAPLNCYEDLSAPVTRRAVADPGSEILVAVANDAWFQNTAAPYQHEALALWRAIENRRYLVRVTNTGVTDVIDPVGRIVMRLPVFEAESAIAIVSSLETRTFYTRYGDVFAFVAVALGGIALVWGRRYEGSRSSSR